MAGNGELTARRQHGLNRPMTSIPIFMWTNGEKARRQSNGVADSAFDLKSTFHRLFGGFDITLLGGPS